MKDEIKEKLDYFRKYATLYENIILNKIEDYIITLQEEKEDYKSRCEKASSMIQFIAYNSERPLTLTELNKVYYILKEKERNFTKEELEAEKDYYKRHQVPFKENYKDYYKGSDKIMKIGDYVRTEYGISKIIGIFSERTMVFIETDNGLGNCNSSQNGKLRKGIAVLEEDYRNFIDNNIKERPIDLIEVGDYVNGYLVKSVDDNGVYIDIPFVDDQSIGCNEDLIRPNQIKSIVTKEQFESMEYKVGE